MRGSPPGWDVLGGYDVSRVVLAVPASHSALQILLGAREEGVPVVLVSTRRHFESIYSRFGWLYDRVVLLDSWRDLLSGRVLEELRGLNAVLVPHGSLVEYVGSENLLGLELPMLGNRYLLEVEASWSRKMALLWRAGIETPRVYRDPGEAVGLVIVKLPGAKGGRGYRVVEAERLEEILGELERLGYSRDELVVQEYLIGVRLYAHYFYSPVLGRVELLGFDERLESNVDGLARLPGWLQARAGVEPGFTVVANQPVVARESLLARVLEYGERFSRAVAVETGFPAIGPYSLEGVVTPQLEYKVFEFSGRIVAGTNVYTGCGSPYGWLYWGERMYMGRRVARELKLALARGRLRDVVT